MQHLQRFAKSRPAHMEFGAQIVLSRKHFDPAAALDSFAQDIRRFLNQRSPLGDAVFFRSAHGNTILLLRSMSIMYSEYTIEFLFLSIG